ncbi:DNA-packaging protein [Erythrobacter sp. EC-HK427]|uniref:DNA-packaging protein n=1 Tax=Erythrobacter sp. EC-HK427 TaxID=2038396 RepID=UPI0012592558|nr:terminase family protein [Erythrobacter sp. EC-HK427]VVT04730.1 ATP-binding protein [Erythrobacter sp. EC-HK427]
MGSEQRYALDTIGRRKRSAFYDQLDDNECDALESYWPLWARPEQMPPQTAWRLWLICAGRGFGKTRAGAEWVRHIACQHEDARIALVARSLGEARAVMVEGESGILACCKHDEEPHFEPSLRRLTWPSGAQATLYSAGEPESLRGPQHSHAWCDEIAKWDNAAGRAEAAWDNLQMGLRLGDHPQVVATTTPRAVPLMRRLVSDGSDPDLVVTRGTTYDNAAHLPVEFLGAMKRQYGESALGRQELEGELLTDIEGALWTRSLLEACRLPACLEDTARIVIGVDPPASAKGDACGIIVAALTAGGEGRVLHDASIEAPSPEAWARRVAVTAREWKADRVVAEANQGGDMVLSVLRAADITLPVKKVHASRGKVARAEPVAALYEAGRVAHVGMLPELEDQMCGMLTGGGYEGPGRSPDRADALVWALTELMLGERRVVPRVRGL